LEKDYRTAASLLEQGQAPGNIAVLNEISVGIHPIIQFLKEKYLQEYISKGGSKIKFVTGKTGSGKTHFLQYLSAEATKEGFVAVNFSAKDVWLHDFKIIYSEIVNRCNLPDCLEKCAIRIIRALGHNDADIPTGQSFADYLSGLGEFDAFTKKEIRNQLQTMFLKNPLMDNNFAIACGLLTGGILGHPFLEEQNKELLLNWLSANDSVRLPAIRRLGMAPSKITKHNARHMLRSLAEAHSMASCPGILILIDDVDILASSDSMEVIRYTKLRKTDAYESIRELIDGIDTLRNIMFVFSFDRKLIDDEKNGLKSYYALWARIQNEIVSDRFNQFTDIIDLDSLGKIIYTKDVIVEMSERLAEVLTRAGIDAKPINTQRAEEILANSQFASTSLPRQIGQATIILTETETEAEKPEGYY